MKLTENIKKTLEGISLRLGGGNTMGNISRSSDIILAVLIMGIISMMIIPLPPMVIDYFIALNLSISVGLLIIALYIPSAVHLSVFPSLLLITTLFRLGLNIASTRQILLNANAGHIIQAFGTYVVGGNFVVGGIIFIIITLVQFIVITKGSERVAEVAARFTLDAMPGKQMSIDADMRAGMIDANQARQRRQDIQKESQLYGAMDGAMKFVKGDAIAGIIITLINVIGGLLIGNMMHGMSLMDSAKTYAILSIGDGLISQLPALFISITAGIVTTRVSSEEKDSNLGKEFSGQLLKQPKALMITAIFLLLIGLIPGFPFAPFLLLALIFGGLGFTLSQPQKATAGGGDTAGVLSSAAKTPTAVDTPVEGHAVISGGGIDSFALTVPIILEFGQILSIEIQKPNRGKQFIEYMIPKMRQALYHDSGVRYPAVHVRTESQTLATDEYSIHLNEVPIVRGKIIPNHLLTNETQENLQRYNMTFTTYKSSLGLPSLWVDSKYEELMKKAGMKFWRPLEVVILHVSYFFRHHGNEFIGIQEVKSILEFMDKSFPDLVKEVTRLIPLQRLTEIFKRLVQEQISIRDLRTILEALSEWAQTEKDTVLLTEYVRSSLKRYISYKYSQGQSVLSVYLVDPEIEDTVRGAIKQTSAGSYLALDPDSVQAILQSVRNTIAPPPPGAQPPILLTAIDVRRFIRKLIEMEHPDVSVVSYQEIIPEIKIQPLGRVQLA
ncbi:MAG: sctV [Chlamydiales bacterium]|jgi:type III secretion protein V|nr:sctV [Chlamydiales bacterium]